MGRQGYEYRSVCLQACILCDEGFGIKPEYEKFWLYDLEQRYFISLRLIFFICKNVFKMPTHVIVVEMKCENVAVHGTVQWGSWLLH